MNSPQRLNSRPQVVHLNIQSTHLILSPSLYQSLCSSNSQHNRSRLCRRRRGRRRGCPRGTSNTTSLFHLFIIHNFVMATSSKPSAYYSSALVQGVEVARLSMAGVALHFLHLITQKDTVNQAANPRHHPRIKLHHT